MSTKFLHRCLALLPVFALLASCGAPVSDSGDSRGASPTAPTAPTAEPAAIVTPLPTQDAPATAQATAVPDAPAPTQAPTDLPPTSAPATAGATAAPDAPAPTQSLPPPSTGIPAGELLFLRSGTLVAMDTTSRRERTIADDVHDFAATPDGIAIALVRGNGPQTDLWMIRRDGSALIRLTQDERSEASPAWASDGSALVFASSAAPGRPGLEWQSWGQWCAQSEVRLIELKDEVQRTLGTGCDPAFSPDGKRVAFAAAPQTPEAGYPDKPPLIINSIRLVNRLGQNGWNFATASGPQATGPNSGRLVYAPSWSPDGQQIGYHRFVGYQALTDLDISEISGSFAGKGQPYHVGAGWLLPARFSPDGRTLAVTQHNYGDARGFSGYDIWSVTLVRLEGSRPIPLPSGEITAQGQEIDQVERGQAAAWAPDGSILAVELPPGWHADLPIDQPIDADQEPGELWLWQPGQAPTERLTRGVDFASPLAWLPPLA